MFLSKSFIAYVCGDAFVTVRPAYQPLSLLSLNTDSQSQDGHFTAIANSKAPGFSLEEPSVAPASLSDVCVSIAEASPETPGDQEMLNYMINAVGALPRKMSL